MHEPVPLPCPTSPSPRPRRDPAGWIGVLALFVAAASAGCGPAPRDSAAVDAPGSAAPDSGPLTSGTLSGVVWAPGQAPGQAPPGQEIPIAGATVYLTTTRPPPIPDGVYCERCIDAPPLAVASAFDGSFTLAAPPGDYWLVVQKGQFRIESQLRLELGRTTLEPARTTLPSHHDPAAGATIPRIAVVLGNNDSVEDILAKMGLGRLNPVTHAFVASEGEFDLYGYSPGAAGTAGTILDLITDPDRLARYHLVFFPCSTLMGGAGVDAALRDQAVLANLRRYVHDGGKLYVTDWSGEVIDRAFPPQLELGDALADSTGSYDPVTHAGTLTSVGTGNGGLYDTTDARVGDPDLAAWLGAQVGPSPSSDLPAPYTPDRLEIVDNWNWIRALHPVDLGLDPSTGQPVVDEPRAWVSGSRPGAPDAHPMSVTFEPTGCGRVLYSTYQTATSPHPGLWAQERILLYLILEIGMCGRTDIE